MHDDLQQLSLKHPAVRAKLGLPDKDSPSSAADSGISTPAITPSSEPEKLQKVSLEDISPATTPLSEPKKSQKVFLEDLSPKELINVSDLKF